MEKPSFTLEFTSVIEYPDHMLEEEAGQRLRALTEGHTDIVGAAVAIEEQTASKAERHFQARIVVYMRPNDVVAVEKAPRAIDALRAALDAVERQVREDRAKLRERWKQSS